MSGIETASLVLAILPLLVNQLDNYVQGLETIKSFRTRRYRAQFESYLTKLGTHHAILLNTLELTLEGVVDHEKDISELIHNPCGAAWNDPKFQGKMRAKLGRNYEPFARNMSELASTLEELSRKLGLDPSTPMTKWSTAPDGAGAPALERAVKKFKTVVSKSIYASLLQNISSTNDMLKTLADQSQHLEGSRKKSRTSRRLLTRHKTVRKLAKSLYNGIIRGKCWKCPCKSHHYVHFGIDTNVACSEDPEAAPQRCRLVFVSKSGQPCAWSWQEIETHPVFTEIKTQAPKSQLSVPKSKVKFAVISVLESLPCPGPGVLDDTPCPQISDMCSTLRSIKIVSQRRELIGFIADEAENNPRHNLYLVRSHPNGLEKVSLEELLVPASPNVGPVQAYRGSMLNRKDRYRLAAVLACGVLQLHGTWLKGNWKTVDILFPKHELATRASLDSPYVPPLALSDGPNERGSAVPQLHGSSSSLIRSEILFPLGLALVELSLSQSMQNLRRPEDDDPVEPVARLKTASRHLEDVYHESGTTYGDVVKRCLFWPGDCDAELDNEDFHDAVFNTVVAPLINELRIFEKGTGLW